MFTTRKDASLRNALKHSTIFGNLMCCQIHRKPMSKQEKDKFKQDLKAAQIQPPFELLINDEKTRKRQTIGKKSRKFTT